MFVPADFASESKGMGFLVLVFSQALSYNYSIRLKAFCNVDLNRGVFQCNSFKRRVSSNSSSRLRFALRFA